MALNPSGGMEGIVTPKMVRVCGTIDADASSPVHDHSGGVGDAVRRDRIRLGTATRRSGNRQGGASSHRFGDRGFFRAPRSGRAEVAGPFVQRQRPRPRGTLARQRTRRQRLICPASRRRGASCHWSSRPRTDSTLTISSRPTKSSTTSGWMRGSSSSSRPPRRCFGSCDSDGPHGNAGG